MFNEGNLSLPFCHHCTFRMEEKLAFIVHHYCTFYMQVRQLPWEILRSASHKHPQIVGELGGGERTSAHCHECIRFYPRALKNLNLPKKYVSGNIWGAQKLMSPIGLLTNFQSVSVEFPIALIAKKKLFFLPRLGYHH